VLCVVAPLVAVTVIAKVPAGVPLTLPPPELLLELELPPELELLPELELEPPPELEVPPALLLEDEPPPPQPLIIATAISTVMRRF
jgi:hypothetical protein